MKTGKKPYRPPRTTAKRLRDTLPRRCEPSVWRAACLAGLLHDMGKFRPAFTEYLLAAQRGERVRRGSVNHSFAAVRFLLDHYHRETPLGFDELAAELLAYAVGAHHGLFDCVAENGTDGFEHRLREEGIEYELCASNFTRQCALASDLDAAFHEAAEELKAVLQSLMGIKATPHNSRHTSRLHNIPSYRPKILGNTQSIACGY